MSSPSTWRIGSVVAVFIVASFVAFSLLVRQPTVACAAGLQVPCGHARLEGKVSAADTGLGLANALVSIGSTSAADFATSVSTNADGTYQIDLPVTLLGKNFNVSAFPSFSARSYLGTPESVAIEMISGTTTSLDFALALGASIGGEIKSAQSSQPLTETTVTAYYYNVAFGSYSLDRSTTVDASGVYTLSGLRSGSYLVYYQPKSVNADHMFLYHDNTYALDDANPFTVTAPAYTQKDMVIGIGARVEGFILRADTDFPVEGAVVYLRDLQGRMLLFAVTDPSGKYVFFGVPPGDYYVVADPESSRVLPQDYDLLSAFYGDTRSLAQADLVTVTAANLNNPGNPVVNVNIHLPVGATIMGSVRDAVSDAPLANVSVTISQTFNPDLPTPGFIVQTDASGVYTATGLEAGAAQVIFSAPTGYLFQVYPLRDLHPFQMGGDLLELELGETLTGIDGELNKASRISGRVTDPDGNPLQNVVIQVEEVGGSTFFYTAFTNANGEYSRLVLPGQYQVRFSRHVICGCYNRQYYAAEGNNAPPATLTVGALATVADIDAILECGVLPPVAEIDATLFMPKLARP